MRASFSAIEFPKGSLLDLVLFGVFICGTGKGMDIKTSRSVGVTKLFWEMFTRRMWKIEWAKNVVEELEV